MTEWISPKDQEPIDGQIVWATDGASILPCRYSTTLGKYTWGFDRYMTDDDDLTKLEGNAYFRRGDVVGWCPPTGTKLEITKEQYAAALINAEDEIKDLKHGLAQICDGLERGAIGEDVTWFSEFETLWEHCAALIGREECLGDDLPQPTSQDREYLIQRLRSLLAAQQPTQDEGTGQ